jgi:hypothetical protein
MSNPVSAPSRSSMLVAILAAIVPLLGIATGWIAYRTAIVSHDTEKIKNQQTVTDARVENNEDKTKQIQDRVNNLTSSADLQKVGSLLSGTWQGEYRCGQGLTGLKLTIYVVDEASLLATFDFFPVSSNPEVPKGTYAMKGTYTISDFDLKSEYWINQPTGYGMANLSGTIPATRDRLTGMVGEIGGSCHNFDLKKVSSKTSKPPT